MRLRTTKSSSRVFWISLFSEKTFFSAAAGHGTEAEAQGEAHMTNIVSQPLKTQSLTLAVWTVLKVKYDHQRLVPEKQHISFTALFKKLCGHPHFNCFLP